jgi:aspartate aminotransferase-like enzyme
MRKFPEVAYMVDTVSSLAGMPVEVDAMGIDLCLASAQKCLALPPGFSLCSVSPKILERARRLPNRGWYFDLVRMAEQGEKGQSHITPTLSHLFAAERQFAIILEEGLEKRWARHREMADRTRAWARERFALYPEPSVCSDTVTCVANSRGIDVAALSAGLKKRGFLISNGYGDLKGKAFRIAHMGERRLEEIEELLEAMDAVLEAR